MSFSQGAIFHLNIDGGSSSVRGFFLTDFDGGTHEGFIHQPPNVGFLMQSNYENDKSRSTPKTSRVNYRQGSDWVFRIVGEIPYIGFPVLNEVAIIASGKCREMIS